MPEDEIAFIHEANTDTEKQELFNRVNHGDIRILIGSTAKMGQGTNVQKRLVALHHLDVPWRPSDVEQREGRILRQGNQNKEVQIYAYVTKAPLMQLCGECVKSNRPLCNRPYLETCQFELCRIQAMLS